MVNSREQIFGSPMCSRGIGKEIGGSAEAPHLASLHSWRA